MNFDSYIDNSVQYEVSATQMIPNYISTTSSHYPISVTFNIIEEVNIEAVTPTAPLQVYPNPTSGEIQVTIAGQARNELQVTGIEIFDMMGRNVGTLRATSLQNGTINISHLGSGTYFLQITMENGATTTQKVVVK